jgi:signal transduction histidine kinase
MAEPTEGVLYFDVDARHVRQLGKELVAHPVTAISELIKNAYDADATEVVVTFRDASAHPGGSLEVQDNGVGMSLDDIASSWMRISTDYKERNPVSERYRRNRAGRKGIGRFAAETLGARLILTSKVEGSPERVTVAFNWEEDYTAGADLGAIPNPYTVELAPEAEHRTVFRIERLHDAWSQEHLKRVRKAVLLLQPPFPVADVEPSKAKAPVDPGFSVRLLIEGEGETVETDLRKETLEAATAIVEGNVDENGNGLWSVESERLGLHDQQPFPKSFLVTGAFQFKAWNFVHAKGALGSISLRDARNLGNEYGGIRVYRDGLRILPYGDRDNDWLGLDLEYRKRGTLGPLANNNWFGHVSISRADNILFIDTASREGVIENDAFQELRGFVRNGLIWAAQRVASARGRKPKAGGRQQPSTRVEILTDVLETATRAVAFAARRKPELAQRELRQIHDRLRRARRADSQQRAVEARLVEEVALLRVLASLGTSIAVFSHEVRATLNASRAALSDIEAYAEQLAASHRARLKELVEDAGLAMEHLGELGSYIEGYVSESRRRTLQPQPMYEVIRAFFQNFDRVLNRREVELFWKVQPESLRTVPMYRSELDAILFNLLTNSLKAMDAEGHTNRRLRVEATEEDGNILLRFQDTGSGIAPEIHDRIFDAFVTSTLPQDSELGSGTGLGLKIVADIADAYRGSVGIGNPDADCITCLEVRLPKLVADARSGEEGAR